LAGTFKQAPDPIWQDSACAGFTRDNHSNSKAYATLSMGDHTGSDRPATIKFVREKQMCIKDATPLFLAMHFS